MRADRPSFGLVVPVFDEEGRFADYGKQLVEFVADQPSGSELIFVDDGSADSTAAQVDELILAHPEVAARLLRRPHEGKGAAVAAGLRELRSEYGGFCDLDLSTPLDELQRVADAAVRAPVLAIASRDVSGSTLERAEGSVRETLGRAYNRLLQATVTPGVVDTQCGAKVASAKVWQQVLPLCQELGFAWDAELVGVALALGIEVQEVPIRWSHDDRSKVRVFRDGAAMVAATPRIWRSTRRAAATGARAAVARPAAGSEVFEGDNATELINADRSHWWFRGKAALVATALRRTGGPRAGGWLVDAGAGSGGVTSMIGWDPEHVAVLEGGEALVRHARTAHGLAAVRSAVEALPLADASASVVCLLDVIEHLADPRNGLREADRVLAPGGRLVISVPAHEWLWSAADEHLGHHRRYTVRALRSALTEIGFEPTLISHVFSWLVPPVWIERRLTRRGEPALGLDRTSFLVDRAAMLLTTAERLLLGRVNLPLGTSLLCVAERRPQR